jgi:hypothetical protein
MKNYSQDSKDEPDLPPCDSQQQFHLKVIYGIAIIIWILLIFYLRKHIDISSSSILILLIPLLLFCIVIFNISDKDVQNKHTYIKTEHLSFWLLLAFPVLTWIGDKMPSKRIDFNKIVGIGIMLSLLSLFDLWAPLKFSVYMSHIRFILTTLSITLLLVLVYGIFMDKIIH